MEVFNYEVLRILFYTHLLTVQSRTCIFILPTKATEFDQVEEGQIEW